MIDLPPRLDQRFPVIIAVIMVFLVVVFHPDTITTTAILVIATALAASK